MSRAALCVLVLTVTLLAGCTGTGSEDLQQDPPTDPVLVTDPGDYSYVENETTDDRSHLHDYWGNAESLLVMDKTIPGGAIVITDAVEVAMLRPDEDQTIPLGTERVDVTVDWADDVAVHYGAVELWVKTAGMDVSEPLGEVEKGDTVTIETTNDDNDLPHQSLSGWEFSLVAYPPEVDPGVGFVRFGAEVHMEAVAHRGLEIPLFPGHPDHWQGADRLVLEDADIKVFVARGGGTGQACLSPCLEKTSPEDGTIVPPGTEVVEFVVTYGKDTQQRLAWEFHGSDTWAWNELAPDATEGSAYTYRIPIGRGMTDGPYAKQSLWEFQPFTPGRVDGVDTASPTDGVFLGDYHVRLSALRGEAAY